MKAFVYFVSGLSVVLLHPYQKYWWFSKSLCMSRGLFSMRVHVPFIRNVQRSERNGITLRQADSKLAPNQWIANPLT